MSSGERTRAELIAALDEQFRHSSGLSVILSQTIAERAGLNPTDMEALDLLLVNGPMTAGRLAELTGLTTGAITGIADRLERAGHVRREIDPKDRRRVIIHPLPEKSAAEIGPLYLPLIEIMTGIYDEFTDEELDAVLRMMTKATEGVTRFIAALRADASPAKRTADR